MERVDSTIQYKDAQDKAYEVLIKYSDGTFPIDPFKIISQLKDVTLYT